MKLNRMLFALAVAALSAMALSQPGGGPGRGGGMRMQIGGGGSMPGYMLLGRLDVQDDLKLTADQKSKLTVMREEMMGQMRTVFQEARGDREAMQKAMLKMNEQTQKQVDTILTPEQTKRLKQIRVQMAGPMAAMDPELGKELGVTEAQKAKIMELQQKLMEANRAVFENTQDRTAAMETVRKNQEAMKVEVGKILTATQRTKLEEMSGPKFVQKDEPGMGMGMGMGGGMGGGRRGGN